MNYQVALGGYYVSSSPTEGTTYYNDAPNAYYEPGFNILFPLQMSVPKCDKIYIVVRRRIDSAGNTFQSYLQPSNVVVRVTDATNGRAVSASVVFNYFHTEWNSPQWTPLVLCIQTNYFAEEIIYRVRTMNVILTDNTNGEFISFQVKVEDNERPFSYLTKYNTREERTQDISGYGSSGVVTLFDKGAYVLLSPVNGFAVSTESESDFSYPPGAIFFKSSELYNVEHYDYSLANFSDDLISQVVSVRNVPGKPSMGVLYIDGYAKTLLAGVEAPYFEVVATSKEGSKNTDVFSVYLQRSPGLFLV